MDPSGNRGPVARRASATILRCVQTYAEQWHGRLLAGVLSIAVAARIVALISFQGSVYGDFLLWDERTYDTWARAILAGESFNVYDQSSLPAYALAAVYRLFGTGAVPARMINVVWGVVACWFIYRIGRDVGGSAAGLLAGLGAALYEPFIFANVTLLKESLVILLFSWVVFLFVTDASGREVRHMIWLGAGATLLIDVRQNAVLAVCLIAVTRIWKVFHQTRSARGTGRAAGAFLVGALVVSAPFAIRNYLDTGHLSPVPVSGFNLYLGNYLPSGTPYYRPVPFAIGAAMEQGVQFTIEAGRREGRNLTPAEASAYWEREVVKEAVRQPVAFAWRLVQKSLAVFNAFEEGDNHSIDFTTRFIPFFETPLLTFGVLAPLGAAGCVIGLRRVPRMRLLLAVFVAYTVTMVAVFTNMRIRLPIVVLLLPSAAAGVLLVAEGIRASPRRGLVYAALVASCVVLETLPLPGVRDFTGHYNTHAINLAGKGRFDEALEYWRESSELKGAYSDYADLALAYDAAYRRHDAAEAVACLERIDDGSYAASRKSELMGDLLRERADVKGAVAAYERSISINSGQTSARWKLIDLLRQIDPGRVDDEEAELRRIEGFYGALQTRVSPVAGAGR